MNLYINNNYILQSQPSRIQKQWKSTVDWYSTRNYQASNNWDPNYMIVLKSKLPKTKTINFKVFGERGNSKYNPIDWDTEFFEKEDNYKIGFGGYRVACHGDSGAGLAVKMYSEYTPFKYILAAIYLKSSHSPFKPGAVEGVPCGAYIKKTTNDGKFEILSVQSEGQTTSWPEIFN